MSTVTRRDFLASTAAAAGAVAFAGPVGRAAEEPATKKEVCGSTVVKLGKTDVETSVLGLGTGTRGGREQREMGTDGFTKMVRHALDRGIRYIDTADMYMMHVFVRLALEGVQRDKYFIQTKTRATHPEVAKADIKRFRREIGCGHIDCLLMHCMTTSSWPTDMRPVMDVLYEAKKRGEVRSVGISCHGMEPLAASVDCDWIDVQLVRINPFGKKMDGSAEDVSSKIKQMHAKGRGVLGMKIFGENGFESSEQRMESLKYVLGLGAVDAFTIGFTSIEQIDETLAMIPKASVA
jgi:predicted aldo/keto reductase-like oxidoreductase